MDGSSVLAEEVRRSGSVATSSKSTGRTGSGITVCGKYKAIDMEGGISTGLTIALWYRTP